MASLEMLSGHSKKEYAKEAEAVDQRGARRFRGFGRPGRERPGGRLYHCSDMGEKIEPLVYTPRKSPSS